MNNVELYVNRLQLFVGLTVHCNCCGVTLVCRRKDRQHSCLLYWSQTTAFCRSVRHVEGHCPVDRIANTLPSFRNCYMLHQHGANVTQIPIVRTTSLQYA